MGLQPFDSQLILDQVKTYESSHSHSASSSSLLSNPDWKKVRRIVKNAMGEVVSKDAKRLINTVDHLSTQTAILTTKVASLQNAILIEKGKRRRGKPLFDNLGDNSEAKSMFFSPSKI